MIISGQSKIKVRLKKSKEYYTSGQIEHKLQKRNK